MLFMFYMLMMCCLDTFLIFDRGLSSYMIWVSLLFHEQVVYKTSADTCRKLRLLIDECHYPSASVFVKIIMLNLLRVCLSLQLASERTWKWQRVTWHVNVMGSRPGPWQSSWRKLTLHSRGEVYIHHTQWNMHLLFSGCLYQINRHTANFGLGVHASYKSYHVSFPTLFQKGP